jgi:hypothetical protein
MKNASCEFAHGKEDARVHGIHMVAIAYNYDKALLFHGGSNDGSIWGRIFCVKGIMVIKYAKHVVCGR